MQISLCNQYCASFSVQVTIQPRLVQAFNTSFGFLHFGYVFAKTKIWSKWKLLNHGCITIIHVANTGSDRSCDCQTVPATVTRMKPAWMYFAHCENLIACWVNSGFAWEHWHPEAGNGHLTASASDRDCMLQSRSGIVIMISKPPPSQNQRT